eukprot:FR743286.1.p1 GENE.FR743286.1~~FR743286.1.p1  ORF type:complete len:116 (+),score=6.09 FR743286.1:293-640(+)
MNRTTSKWNLTPFHKCKKGLLSFHICDKAAYGNVKMVSTALGSKRVLCEHRTFTHVHKHAHEVPVFQCSAAMSIERGIASEAVLVTAVVMRMKWAVRLVLIFESLVATWFCSSRK